MHPKEIPQSRAEQRKIVLVMSDSQPTQWIRRQLQLTHPDKKSDYLDPMQLTNEQIRCFPLL